MFLDRVGPGANIPEVVNVIIEIPLNGEPVKYEVDKDTGAIFVDRFLSAAMRYPCNYGYVPRTISGDGDPCDALVVSPLPLIPGSVIECRPIGLLKMEDDGGDDAKLLMVPIDRLTPRYRDVSSFRDLTPDLLERISHFFERYKDLEPGKWVKVTGWAGIDAAREEIEQGIKKYG